MARQSKHRKTCPAPGCKVSIPKGNVFCFRHWFAMPDDIRDRICIAMSRHDALEKARAVGDALKLFAEKAAIKEDQDDGG